MGCHDFCRTKNDCIKKFLYDFKNKKKNIKLVFSDAYACLRIGALRGAPPLLTPAEEQRREGPPHHPSEGKALRTTPAEGGPSAPPREERHEVSEKKTHPFSHMLHLFFLFLLLTSLLGNLNVSRTIVGFAIGASFFKNTRLHFKLF